MSALRWTFAALWVLVLGTAIAVVWTKHEARSRFIQLQGLNGQRDALDIEWGQLKLEQSAWATHGRVEQAARVDLHMVIPRPDEVRIVTAGAPAPERRTP
jgi:cell division protein FtsL